MCFPVPVPRHFPRVRALVVVAVLLAMALPLAAFSPGTSSANSLAAGPRPQLAQVATGGCTPWILDRSANPGGADNALLGVAARTFTDAWAVGYQDQPSQHGGQTLIEHWNGIAWASVPSPSPATGVSSGFSGVTSIVANNAWAVGYSYPSTYIQSTLIEHWDGQT